MHIQTCVQWLPDKCSLHKTTVEEKLVSREKKMFNLTFPNLTIIISKSECKKLQRKYMFKKYCKKGKGCARC